MPALQSAAVDVGGDFAPVFDGIEERFDHALAAPDGEEGHADLVLEVLLVVEEIDRGRGAVVLAGGVDGARVLEGAHVRGHGGLVEMLEAALAAAQALEDVERPEARYNALGNRAFLEEQEPWVKGAG